MSTINPKKLSVLSEIEPLLPPDVASIRDHIVSSIYQQAEEISLQAIRQEGHPRASLDTRIDNILTSRWLGYPIMFILLILVLWIINAILKESQKR
ncbi:MAG: hypothetical protein ACOX6E_02655 [Syntrophomonadaceae bacterium]